MKDILIVDLETTSPEPAEAIIKVFGAYDPMENKYFIYKWNEQSLAKAIELMMQYALIVTFNGDKYDFPVLERHGVNMKGFKHIDVRKVLKYQRAALLKKFKGYSLRNLVLEIGLDDEGKGEIDYEIFKLPSWTPAQQAMIVKYLKQDLVCTWKLWKYLVDKFGALGKYLKPSDVAAYKHITASLPLYSYKVICAGSKEEELYDENPRYKQYYPAIYTMNPRKKIVVGSIAHLKFTKLYGHIVTQYNLTRFRCTCCPSNEGKYHGKNIYTVKGFYCAKNQGPIEKYLEELYVLGEGGGTDKLVRNIVFDNINNIITNPVYYTTYDPNASHDCYSLARQQAMAMMRKFAEAGYFVIYIEGDDVFIQLDPSKGQTYDALLKVKDEVIAFLKTRMPFPSNTFDMRLHEKANYLRFFSKGDVTNVFLRRGMYFYKTEDGRVASKGLTQEAIEQALAEAA